MSWHVVSIDSTCLDTFLAYGRETRMVRIFVFLCFQYGSPNDGTLCSYTAYTPHNKNGEVAVGQGSSSGILPLLEPVYWFGTLSDNWKGFLRSIPGMSRIFLFSTKSRPTHTQPASHSFYSERSFLKGKVVGAWYWSRLCIKWQI